MKPEKEPPPLVGDRVALFRLFSLPQGLPHGASWGLTGKARRLARWQRTHRSSWRRRQRANSRRVARFAIPGDGKTPGGTKDDRRKMRNARKQERRAAR